MDTNLFYELWEKFSQSDISESLPDDVIEFCKENNITIEYFIAEFI